MLLFAAIAISVIYFKHFAAIFAVIIDVFVIYGFNPIANSPIYLLPSSVSKISFSSFVLFEVAFIIFPKIRP